MFTRKNRTKSRTFLRKIQCVLSFQFIYIICIYKNVKSLSIFSCFLWSEFSLYFLVLRISYQASSWSGLYSIFAWIILIVIIIIISSADHHHIYAIAELSSLKVRHSEMGQSRGQIVRSLTLLAKGGGH